MHFHSFRLLVNVHAMALVVAARSEPRISGQRQQSLQSYESPPQVIEWRDTHCSFVADTNPDARPCILPWKRQELQELPDNVNSDAHLERRQVEKRQVIVPLLEPLNDSRDEEANDVHEETITPAVRKFKSSAETGAGEALEDMKKTTASSATVIGVATSVPSLILVTEPSGMGVHGPLSSSITSSIIYTSEKPTTKISTGGETAISKETTGTTPTTLPANFPYGLHGASNIDYYRGPAYEYDNRDDSVDAALSGTVRSQFGVDVSDFEHYFTVPSNYLEGEDISATDDYFADFKPISLGEFKSNPNVYALPYDTRNDGIPRNGFGGFPDFGYPTEDEELPPSYYEVIGDDQPLVYGLYNGASQNAPAYADNVPAGHDIPSLPASKAVATTIPQKSPEMSLDDTTKDGFQIISTGPGPALPPGYNFPEPEQYKGYAIVEAKGEPPTVTETLTVNVPSAATETPTEADSLGYEVPLASMSTAATDFPLADTLRSLLAVLVIAVVA